MSTIVPMYGFGGGGGTGATLTVTAPSGCTVTVSKDGKTKTKTAGADGVAVFRGLATGQWTVTITDGEQTAQKAVTITADYSTAITFFSATIHVTYPAGSTCTATDGVTTLTAPDTSGTWDCVVQNAGTWTVRITDGTKSKEKVVAISEDGQSESVELSYIIYIVQDGVLTDIGMSNHLISARIANVTQGDGYVNFKNAASESLNGILSGEKVDLTDFTIVVASVKIKTAGTSTTQSKFKGTGLILTQGTGYSSTADAASGIEHEALSSSTGTKTLTIDATSITGEWYVGFAMGTSANFDVYDLYVE